MENTIYKKPGSDNGFTVAELLLVVIIIALVGGVGGGLYVGTYKKVMVQKSARQLVRTAKYAKILAVERQKPCKLVLDQAQKHYYLTVESVDEETQQPEKIVVRNEYCRPAKLADDVAFEKIQIASIDNQSADQSPHQRQDGKYVIIFAANGTCDGGIVQIGDGKRHYTVVFSSASGKATMLLGTTEKVQTETIDLDII